MDRPAPLETDNFAPNAAATLPSLGDLEDFFENGAVGLHLVGPDGIILRANRAELELLGYAREEYVGRNIREFHADDDVIANILLCLGRGETLDKYPARLKAKDGSIKHVLITSSALFKGDEFVHTRCFTIDVTEQRRLEEAAREDRERLREREHHWRQLLEALPAAVYTTDADGRIDFYNQAAVDLAGRRPEIGERWCVTWKLYWPDGTPLEHEECPMALSLKEGRPVRGAEAVAERPDGTRVPFVPYPTPLHDEAGRLVGGINMLVDISGRKAVEATLRDAHEQLEMVLKTIRVGLWQVDLVSGKVTVSATCKANFGLPPEAEFTHETMFAAMHPDDRALFRAVREKALAGEAPYEVEYRNFWPDGSQHWVFTRASVIRNDAGQPVRLAGLSLDITERRRAEAALRASEERLARLLELAPLGIAEVAPSGRILYANAAAERILRLSRSEIEGRRYDAPAWTVTTPAGMPIAAHETPPARALRGERVDDQEVAVVSPDGHRVIISVSAMPLRDHDPRATAALVAFTDVTGRHAAEMALRESEERFRTLANNIPQLAWMANADGWIFWYNQRWYDYTGTIPADMEGWGWQSVHDPEVLPKVLERWRKSLATGEAFDMVFPLKGADGILRPFLTRVEPVYDSSGQVIRWFGTNTDISEQRRIEEALRASETALQRLNETLEQRVREEVAAREQAQAALFQVQKLEAIGQLTGGVAHDFNNLLTAVIGNLDILRRERLNERSHRLIEAATRSAERGAKLTQQLLAYARRQHLASQAVDVNELLAGLQEMLRRTLGGLVHVEARLAPDLWPALGDPTQLELAILNLAINARDAMPLGGSLLIETANVQIEARGELDLDPGSYVHIAVSDTGTGMTPEVLDKAMDPFFTTKEVGKGSGLGLSQVYGVVKQCGGTIRLDSEPGTGTTVLIWLPRATAAPKEVQRTDHSGAVQRGLRGRLLVVDDDPDVRNVAVEVLHGAGYHVEEAESGAAALEIVDSGIPVDLAIVDYAMPRMSGTQFMAAARQRRPDLPVVYITGYADPQEVTQDPTAVILRKPYRIPELLRTTEEVLSRPPRPAEAGKIVPIAARNAPTGRRG